MKFMVFVICLAVYAAAEPSCPPESETDTPVYFPHPSDCSKFLTCHFGNLVELSCPTGTSWNDSIKACDVQTNVVCPSHPETTTAPATTTTDLPTSTTTEFQTTTSSALTSELQTTTSTEYQTTTTSAPTTTTPTAPTGKCPDNPDPDQQVFLPHADCTKYYICTWGGVAVEQSCPPNLHWNQHLSYCDYPQNAGCASTSAPTPSGSTTTAASQSTSTHAPYPTDSCPEVYDPNHQVYFPHPDCSKYYICTYEGNKLEQNCPAGLHWSQAHSYCDRPELSECTSAKQANECPEGYDPEHPTFIPHEQDCDRYYVCYDGHLIEHQCTDDLYWNQSAGKCADPEEVECPAVTVAPAIPECPEVEESEDLPAFFPHEDCTQYYVCSNGYPVEMTCPVGTYWNAQENVCDAPESSGCVPQRG